MTVVDRGKIVSPYVRGEEFVSPAAIAVSAESPPRAGRSPRSRYEGWRRASHPPRAWGGGLLSWRFSGGRACFCVVRC